MGKLHFYSHAQGAVIAAVAVMILGVIMGIRTSLQAASGNKPFTLEGKAFEKKGKAGPGGDNVETNPRDTDEEDASNGDWLSDPMCEFVTFFLLSHFFLFFFIIFSEAGRGASVQYIYI